MRRISLVAVALAALVAAAPAAGGVDLRGTVTLKRFNVTKECRTGLSETFDVSCVVFGTFAGSPRAAGASYGWLWRLEVENETTTGFGSEEGELALNFGNGVVRLTLMGRQAPVGTPTAANARGRTTGTWRVKSGTGAYKGLRDSGKYTFVTARKGSRNTFSVAKLTLR
jgi:hypothetical protein